MDSPQNVPAPSPTVLDAITLTADEVRKRLHHACEEAGGQVYFAKLHGISAAYVNDVFNGRKEAGAGIAGALGFARVVVYRPLANLEMRNAGDFDVV